MLNIIKSRQFAQKAKPFALAGGLIVALILIVSLVAGKGQEEGYKYDTVNEALKAYYLNECGNEITDEELSKITLNSFNIDKIHYYLMKEHAKEDKRYPYVYVLAAGKDGDNWSYEKVTADFMLASPDNPGDSEEGPDAEYDFSIEDKRIFVGMLSASDDTPAVKGEHFTIDEDDGVYSYIYTVEGK